MLSEQNTYGLYFQIYTKHWIILEKKNTVGKMKNIQESNFIKRELIIKSKKC